MDRRMYRGSTGNMYNSNRNTPPYRMEEHACGDICGRHAPEDPCIREDKECELKNCPLAMCYVPWQVFRNLYENEFVALERGTMFKELDLDWYGRGCK